VRPYVEDFDVAVVPSVYPDPLPRSVLESMSLAKPVVAFDVGGIGEMVEDGVTGILVHSVDPPDIDGLADALVRLVKAPEARKKMGRVARDHTIRKHGAHAHSREVEEILLRAMR
jgi:glycosyltransferase involved in cell wall biosynthesis